MIRGNGPKLVVSTPGQAPSERAGPQCRVRKAAVQQKCRKWAAAAEPGRPGWDGRRATGMSKAGKSSRRECQNANQSQFQDTVREVRHNFSRQSRASCAVRSEETGGVFASIPRRNSRLSPAWAGVPETGVTGVVVSLVFTVGSPSTGLTRNGSWMRATRVLVQQDRGQFSRARARPE